MKPDARSVRAQSRLFSRKKPDKLTTNGSTMGGILGRMLLAQNASYSRDLGEYSHLLDPRRSYNHECGYPETDALLVEDYLEMYRRESIANRVVRVMPMETWAGCPSVFEVDAEGDETEFEKSFKSLDEQLGGEQSWYKDDKQSPLWEILRRADIQSRIGSLGIVLLGINDKKDLSEPVDGVEETGSLPTESPSDRTIEPGPNPLFNMSEEPEHQLSRMKDRHARGSLPARTSNSLPTYNLEFSNEGAAKGGDTKYQLKFLTVFSEADVDVTRYETNPQSVRFGHPVEYSVTFNNQNTQVTSRSSGFVGAWSITKKVHWTRVVHLADNIESSTIIGVPAQRPCYNNLLNLHKVYGGNAEGYWRSGFPLYTVESHPELGADVELDYDSIEDEMEQMFNTLQRFGTLAGASLKSHAPSIVDPTAPIKIQLEAIAIMQGMPMRIFMGSERGELASSEDKGTWNDRKLDRQLLYISPRVIAPLVNRCIQLGVLVKPDNGFGIEWPPLDTLSASEQVEVSAKRMDAAAKYIQGNVSTMYSPLDFLMREWDLTEEDAKEILDRALDEENNPLLTGEPEGGEALGTIPPTSEEDEEELGETVKGDEPEELEVEESA